MARFRLIVPEHQIHDRGMLDPQGQPTLRTLKKNEEIESAEDLMAMHPGKFERVVDPGHPQHGHVGGRK